MIKLVLICMMTNGNGYDNGYDDDDDDDDDDST